MSLLGEIKRRKVFQVAAVYAVVAWLIIQIVDVVSEPLSLPTWLDAVVIILLAVGFPIAVILAWAFDVTPQGIKTADEAQAGISIQPAAQPLNYLTHGLVLLAVGFLVADQYFLGSNGANGMVQQTPDSSVRRYSITLDPEMSATASYTLDTGIALSNDGHSLIYAANVGGEPVPYLRRLDKLTAQPIPGLTAGFEPFFSPDDQSLGFIRNERLYRIPVSGGSPRLLAEDVRGGTGAFWSSDGTIIFSARPPQGFYRLHEINADGGTGELLNVAFDRAESTHTWPHLLPGGTHLLFTVRPAGGNARDGRIALLSLESGESRTLIETAYNARYASSGHIIFVRSAALWAVSFDARNLEITGREIPVVDDVQTIGTRGGTAYTFSNDGRLIYLPGADRSALGRRHLVWVDRSGREEIIDTPALPYLSPRLSPDGEQAAVSLRDETGNGDVWKYDLTNGNSTQLTFERGYDGSPLWTPDGQRIVFRSSDASGTGLFWKRADGSGQEERLTTSSFSHTATSFTPDGELIYTALPDPQNDDIHVLSLDDKTSRPLILTDFADRLGAISPDGRWLAYTSNSSGAGDDIYVHPYPNVEAGTWRVSLGGGLDPRWGADGRELFYRDRETGSVMVVTVVTEPTFSPGEPEILFSGDYIATASSYDVSFDGQRFLMLKNAEQVQTPEEDLVVIENWFEELNRLAPPSE